MNDLLYLIKEIGVKNDSPNIPGRVLIDGNKLARGIEINGKTYNSRNLRIRDFQKLVGEIGDITIAYPLKRDEHDKEYLMLIIRRNTAFHLKPTERVKLKIEDMLGCVPAYIR